MTRKNEYIKPNDGKDQFFSTGDEIFKGVFIHKNVDSNIPVLTQQVPAQVVPPQVVILSPWRRICAQVKEDRAWQRHSFPISLS